MLRAPFFAADNVEGATGYLKARPSCRAFFLRNHDFASAFFRGEGAALCFYTTILLVQTNGSL
jgi:hypothetical protein